MNLKKIYSSPRKFIAVIMILCGIGFILNGIFSGGGVAPRENADGTIDYTLIAKLPKKTWKWVLRFPKDVWIDLPEERDSSGRFVFNGASYSSKTLPNGSFNFYLNVNDLSFMPWGTSRVDPEVISVYVDPWPRAYREMFRNREIGFVLHYGYKKAPECRLVKEIRPGFFKFRNATREEKLKFIKGNPMTESDQASLLRNYCVGKNSPFIYALYNSDNDPVTGGGCYESGRGYCRITVWLPEGRHVTLGFDREHILKLDIIYEKIIEIFSTATVVEQSDLNWGRPI